MPMDSLSFKDLFSCCAADYARYRPTYPDSLFEFIARSAPGKETVWDCGTGDGQAALGLAEHFQHVIATDASAGQIAKAFPHPAVTYMVSPAEKAPIPDRSQETIT